MVLKRAREAALVNAHTWEVQSCKKDWRVKGYELKLKNSKSQGQGSSSELLKSGRASSE